EAGRLGGVAGGQESIGDAALVEDLDGAGLDPAGAGTHELLGGPLLDDRGVDARAGSSAAAHQAGRAGPGDEHALIHHPRPTLVHLPRLAASPGGGDILEW